MSEEMMDERLLTDAQWRAFHRAAHCPNRIVLDQVAITEKGAELLVAAGLWERGIVEYWHGSPRQRYRFTSKGLAKLASQLPA